MCPSLEKKTINLTIKNKKWERHNINLGDFECNKMKSSHIFQMLGKQGKHQKKTT